MHSYILIFNNIILKKYFLLVHQQIPSITYPISIYILKKNEVCAFFKRQKKISTWSKWNGDGAIIYSYISERGTGRSIELINYKWASVLDMVQLKALAHSTELSVIFQLTETLTSWMTNSKRCLKITRLRTHKNQSMYSGFLRFFLRSHDKSKTKKNLIIWFPGSSGWNTDCVQTE